MDGNVSFMNISKLTLLVQSVPHTNNWVCERRSPTFRRPVATKFSPQNFYGANCLYIILVESY